MPKYTQIKECNVCSVNLYWQGLFLWGKTIIGLLEVYVLTLPSTIETEFVYDLNINLKLLIVILVIILFLSTQCGGFWYALVSLLLLKTQAFSKVKWSWKKNQLSNKGANTFLFHSVMSSQSFSGIAWHILLYLTLYMGLWLAVLVFSKKTVI